MGKAIGIIPARWNSTRFPGKPLYSIAGKVLLQRVWERCRRAKSLDSLIVATDDMRIAEAAFAWGAEVALTSPHHRSGTDRIADVARRCRNAGYIVNIQGDEPLIDPKLIDRIVALLRRDRTIGIVTAAHRFNEPSDAASEHQVKVVLDRNRHALYFSRKAIPFQPHAAKGRYLRHQGIYGYRREVLLSFVRWKPSPLERAESLEQLRALENGVRIQVVVTGSGSLGVDTPEDAKAIEGFLQTAGRRTAARKRPPRP